LGERLKRSDKDKTSISVISGCGKVSEGRDGISLRQRLSRKNALAYSAMTLSLSGFGNVE